MPLPGAGEGLRLYAAPRPSSGVGWAAGLLGRIGWKAESVELLIARNPDPDSRLPYLLWLPLAGGMVFRTSGTWPRTNALYCYPVSADEWPEAPDIVERAGVRSCVRRGAAIDLVLDRGRENRSQIVFTRARGRDAVFWQSPRTRKQARPNVTTPTARAAGIAELEIVVDSHEQYAYRFGGQRVSTVKRQLPCGDYGLVAGGRLVASVERKSLTDLVASLTGGKLRYALAELAALPAPRSCQTALPVFTSSAFHSPILLLIFVGPPLRPCHYQGLGRGCGCTRPPGHLRAWAGPLACWVGSGGRLRAWNC